MVTRNEIEKISLTRRQLQEVTNPLWRCFGKYDQVGCGLECSQHTHRLCRKVTLFLRRTQ
jgi:hypothetical protein